MIQHLPRLIVACCLLLPSTAGYPATRLADCHPDTINVRHSDRNRALHAATVEGQVCVDGEATAVRLEVRNAPVAEVLAALKATYRISYRYAIAPTETRDGSYAGSLEEVIGRLLSGYDYIFKHRDGELDIAVFATKAEHPTATPAHGAATVPAVRISQNNERERPPVHGARDH